jgi:hypothetical protein
MKQLSESLARFPNRMISRGVCGAEVFVPHQSGSNILYGWSIVGVPRHPEAAFVS